MRRGFVVISNAPLSFVTSFAFNIDFS